MSQGSFKNSPVRVLGSWAPGWAQLLTVLILACAWLVAVTSRLFSVIRFESIIHEFDPWFNYRATQRMVDRGFYDFLNWFDERAWYPLGRIVGGTVYPGLMITSGSIYYVLNLLNFPIHIREICVFLAPFFSGLTVIATFLLTKELWNTGAGLLAGCFIAIAPGYISRSVAGSYDNEGIAIFALMFTYYLWIKAVKKGSVLWSVACAISYLYMVSAWGGYVFIINLVPLHVFVLLLMQRFSSRIYVAYTSFYILGLLFSMQIPFVGFQPIKTSEHMASAGVFALLQAYAILGSLRSRLTKTQFRTFFFVAVTTSAALVLLAVVALTYLGFIAPWSGRFYSLWDTGYAKIHIPIIASVSEHQPTTWVSFFFDLHMLAVVFPTGVWLCIKQVNDERVFIILYAISASYFAGVMVRLMLTLTPVVCILAAVVFNRMFEIYLKEDNDEKEEVHQSNASISCSSPGTTSDSVIVQDKKLYDKVPRPKKKMMMTQPVGERSSPKDGDGGQDQVLGVNTKTVVVLVLIVVLCLFVVHCTWVTSNAYSSPSIVLASYNNDGSRNILDDFREAYYWLSQNTDQDARIMSWWDYGYQIAGMANRTTLVDNNTWNNTHIALVGKAMASNESVAYKIMTDLDVDYVLVIFGGVIGYSGDDINKFLWMVRIAEGESPGEIRESDYFSPQNGQYKIDSTASETMLNSLMYKMSYHRFGELQLDPHNPAGFDRTRNTEIGKKHFSLEHVEEAYTTEHWLVRIYRVKKRANLGGGITNVRKKSPRFRSRKTVSNKKGMFRIKSTPRVVKGTRRSRK